MHRMPVALCVQLNCSSRRCATSLFRGVPGWNSQEQVESNISAFRAGSYPLDAIVMDYDWFGTSRDNYADFGFNPRTMTRPGSFDEPQMLIKHYWDAYGVRFGGIRKPVTYDHINEVQGRRNWPLRWQAQQNELNFSTASLRAWYANHTAPLLDAGVAFFWNG